uniref:NYN domain-containing protein n=1 Tax=uncultured marine group II/III euryarchaeote SAT1000_51_D10 TaxID=1456587 RepID=A0A075IEV1_9EURY|nr:hypothetical protein [uncultured marine group II/III euryarchaeote SAT1000_51_D10]
MRKWFRNWIGSPESPPQAHILFVDGENSPPAPDLMMEAVLSHAGCELDLAFAWAKWYPTSLLLRGLREVGVECIQADEGSNNADIMLSLRAMKEVNKRAGLGQGGIAYVAFGTDKGFSHLLREIRTTKGWKSVYVTSFEDPPSILARSSSEVLYVRRSDGRKKKPVKSLRPKEGRRRRRRPKKEAQSKTLDRSELDTSKKDELEKLLISLIGEGSVNVAALGNRISAYQKNNGLQDTGSKVLLKEFGLTGSLNQVITREFSEKISAEATSFRTSPETGKKIPTSFEYSVKRTTRPDSLSNDVDQVKFINSIEELLSGDDEISVMVIGNRIRKMQEVNEWEELGTRSFLQHHGFSRNFGLLNALKLCFGNQIEIEGNINAQRIKFAGKKNEESLEEE